MTTNWLKILWILWAKKWFPENQSDYEASFIYFAQHAQQFWYKILRLQIQHYDAENNMFTKAREYSFQDNRYITLEKDIPHIDIILHRFNHCLFPLFSVTEHFTTINSLAFLELTHDKYYTAKYFQEQSPLSFVVLRPIEDQTKPEHMVHIEKFVMKPRTWSRWHGVILWTREDVIAASQKIQGSWNSLIVQEFIDSSWWVLGIVEGIHDIRVIVFAGKIPYVIVRTPETGDFRCNLVQWGSQKVISYTSLPTYWQETIQRIMHKVQSLTKDPFCVYSIDLFEDGNNNIRLIELNSSIWLWFLDTFQDLRPVTLEYLCWVCDKILSSNK